MELRTIVIFQSQVPSDARASADGAELMDNVAGNEIDVVVLETNLSVANAISTELVELGLLNPTARLKNRTKRAK